MTTTAPKARYRGINGSHGVSAVRPSYAYGWALHRQYAQLDGLTWPS
jgi:hypothetical protein